MTHPIYENAAECIPDYTFIQLRRLQNMLPAVNAYEVAGVRIQFQPGDMTLYDIVIVRTNRAEAVVTVANMGLAWTVPFGDGSYVHPSYLESHTRGVGHGVTCAAVAAVVNRAIAAAYGTEPDAVDRIDAIREGRDV